MNILTHTVATLIPACFIGRPAPAYGGGPEGGATEAPPATDGSVKPVTAFPDIGEVSGGEQPNWDAYEQELAAKKGAPPPPSEQPLPPPTDPARGEGKPPGQEPAKPAETPPPATTTPKTPETPEKTATSAAIKPDEAPKGTQKPPETGAFDPDAALKAADAIQLKENASQKTRDGFKELRGHLGRACEANKQLAAQLTEAQKRANEAPKLDPELEKELAELREFRATWESENDPKFTEQFNKDLAAAEDKLLKTLVDDPDLALPQAQADELKKAGFDTKEGRELFNGMLNELVKVGDHLLLEKVKRLWYARQGVLDSRDARIQELRAKQGGFLEAQKAAEEGERQNWGKSLDGKLIELFKDPASVPWGHYKTITDDMDPAAKLAAEAFNKELKETTVPRIRETIQAAYGRDPEKIGELIFSHFALEHAKKELTAAQTEIGKLNDRIKELEEIAKGVRRISDPTTRESAPAGPPVTTSNLDMTAEQAADAYMAEKHRRV